MLSYNDAVNLCNVLNRTRTEQHEMLPETLVRNLNYSFNAASLAFEFDGLYGYKVTHLHNHVEDSPDNG